MTLRSLAASAALIAFSLAASAIPAISEEAPAQTAPFQVAAVQGTAPDFTGLGNWFNSAPLNIASLRGKVVLVNFWTYG
ncbi:MAG: thioredoxin, partial [Bradyrhizobium sp.]